MRGPDKPFQPVQFAGQPFMPAGGPLHARLLPEIENAQHALFAIALDVYAPDKPASFQNGKNIIAPKTLYLPL